MTLLCAGLAGLACVAGLSGCAAPWRATAAAEERALVEPGALPVLSASGTMRHESGLQIDRWWTLFGDPALDALIEQALQRSHDLAVAAARVREARARLDELHGAELPSVAIQAGHGRSQLSTDGMPPGSPRYGSSHNAALTLRYELDLWGRLDAGSEAARARLLSQEWARASIEWSLTAQLAEAHFSLRAVQRQIEISEAVRAGRATTLSLRQRERQAGIGNEFDSRRAEAELAGTEATLSSLRRQRAGLEATLALLSGRPLAEITMQEPLRVALDPTESLVARLPSGNATALLLNRPDVRQAEAQLNAAQFDIRAARAATLPSLSFSGSVGSDAMALSGLFTGPGAVWAIAMSATHTLFDGGQAKARVGQADARADAAWATYRQTVLASVLELREAYAALETSQQAHAAQQLRVAALERARSLAELGYATGAFAYIDLLDAERNSYQAQLDEVTAYRDRLLGQVAAFKALGGGHAGVADRT
jgi:multidrug efflux system outer membrane protein